MNVKRTSNKPNKSVAAVIKTVAKLPMFLIAKLGFISHLGRRVDSHLHRRFKSYARYRGWRHHRHVNIGLVIALIGLVGWWSLTNIMPARALETAPVEGEATVVNTGGTLSFSADDGASVTIDNISRQFSGNVWSSDLGWINFGVSSGNSSSPVSVDKLGNLSGSATSVNAGTINFDSSVGSNVVISDTNVLSGYAWSNDLGWIDFSGVSIPGYNPDLLPPDNPTVSAFSQSSGSSLASGNWYNYAAPYFTWDEPADHADNITPGGVAGYFVYFGTDGSADPASYQTGRSFQANNLGSYNGTYYLRIKTKDASGNISDAETVFTYKYDVTTPTVASYVSVAPSGYSHTNHFIFSWPVNSSSGAIDEGGSGVKGYQYKINGESSWHDISGDGATSSVTLDDVATSGVNTFDLRTADNAGNYSSSVRTNFYYNESAPNAPRNLSVTPSLSTTNRFAFSWDAPEGEIAGYYYSINALPTESNVSYTTGTSLSSGPYATQQGENTFYIVAKDAAGNYDLNSCSNISGNPNADSCAKIVFTARTAAPGIPTNVQAYDISDRETKDYAIAIKWVAPSNVGAGIAGYDIYRSTDGRNFSKIGTTTSTVYSDGDLESKVYYYYVKARNDANNLSAESSVVSETPTGRYTTPPELLSGPSMMVTPTTIEVKWVTDRPSSSMVKIKQGNVFVSEQGQTSLSTEHAVKVVGLKSQSNYTYSVQSTDQDGNTVSGDEQQFTTENLPSIYGLEITNVSQTSAIINFKSTAIANFTLYYGSTSNYGKEVKEASSSSTTNHSLAINGLQPGQMYYFRVVGYDDDGNELRSENSFNTLPIPAIKNLKLQPVADAATTTVRITWETNVPTSSTVDYQADGVKPLMSSNTDLSLVHEIILSDLADTSNYKITISGRDQFGNMTQSNELNYTTPEDSRPPGVSNIATEASNVGNSSSQAQIVVSWTTDEPATSQVEYDSGLSGSDYTRKTTLDNSYTTKHLVIVSGLESGTPYHLRIRSSDKAGNMTVGNDRSVITGEVPSTGLQMVINTLERLFGWL